MDNRVGMGDYSPAHKVLWRNADALARANARRQRAERWVKVRTFLRDEFGEVPIWAWLIAIAAIGVAANLFLGRPLF